MAVSAPDTPGKAKDDEAKPQPSIAELLIQARAAELNRKRCANRKVDGQFNPDYASGVDYAKTALKLRQQAHAQDPHHTDPAWHLDVVPSERICTWLREWIALP